MSKTTTKYAPEVRERAVRMVMDHGSRWAAVGKIGTVLSMLMMALFRYLDVVASL